MRKFNEKLLKWHTILYATFLLFFVFSTHNNLVAAQTSKAIISNSTKNKQLGDVLNSISKQTGIEFLFSPEGINSKQTIYQEGEGKTLKQFLDEDIKQLGIEHEFLGEEKILLHPSINNTLAYIGQNTGSQQKVQNTITGKVYDKENKPIEYVSVLEKGTKNATFTLSDGSFSLNVTSATAQLVFSSVGYTSVTVNASDASKIIMQEETNVLEEVIAVGYTSKSRAELGSSLTTLSAEQLTDLTSSDIGSMIQGKAAGVFVTNATGQPGSRSEIRIRGTGSITAQADPLYVVDGIIGGDFNPNDVETLTVLKDAGATALYGSAASGGVIVITTKQPKGIQPTRVDFNANVGLKYVTQGRLEMMDGRELYKTHRAMMSSSLFEAERPNILAKRNFNWMDAAFKQGILQDYYLSVSGKGEKVGYYLSANYYDEEGTLINTGFKRLNTRGNFNIRLAKKLTLNTRLSVSNAKTDTYHYTTLEDGYKNLPWDYPYDVYGDYVKINSDRRPDGSRWYSQDKRNFLHSEQYNSFTSKANQFTADVQLIYNVTNWLTLESANRAGFGNDKYTEFIDPRSYSPEWKNGYLGVSNSDYNSVGSTNMIKSNKTFGNHSLDGFVGIEFGQSSYNMVKTSGTNLPVGIKAPSATTPLRPESNYVPTKSLSFFGQAQYSYKSKLFATVSVRRDGSSQFGPDNRWGTFPAASASWLVNKENFMSEVKFVNFLKVRASYGVTGNSNIAPFKYLSIYSFNVQYNNQVGAIPVNLSNPELGWESAYMTNVGVDLGLFKRIDLNIDLYNIDNKDLLLNVPESPSNGFEYQLKNIGSVRNQGIEIQLSTRNLIGAFKWETNFNIAFNKNKVTKLPDNIPFTQKVNDIQQIVKTGNDIYTWFLPRWLGVNPKNGDPMWEQIVRDSDGNIIERKATSVYSEAEPQEVGKATPKFTGGFNNTFSYKMFTLNVNCNFVVGNKIYNLTREIFDADGAYLGYNMMKLQDGWTRWTQEGDQATHPKLVMNGNKHSNKTSSRYLEDGDFFRITNIRLACELPSKWLNRFNIRRTKIFASADNLLTITKFSGMDPEVSLKSGAYTLAGLYSFQYPNSRRYMFGIEFNF